MANKDVVERLSRDADLLGLLEEGAPDGRARRSSRIQHAAGSVVATEGEPGVGLFIIDRGRSQRSRSAARPSTRSARVTSSGRWRCSTAAPTATVTAKTDLSLFVLTGWVYRGLLTEHPSIAIRTLEARGRASCGEPRKSATS
mgnify:CR=1 FL=1